MEYLRQLLRQLDPIAAVAAALLCLLAAIVAVINWQGKRLRKHDDLLYMLEVRIGNIHKDREATRARKLQHPLVPPPMPVRTPTIDATDWLDDDQTTEDLSLKNTVRYPLGKPTKENE